MGQRVKHKSRWAPFKSLFVAILVIFILVVLFIPSWIEWNNYTWLFKITPPTVALISFIVAHRFARRFTESADVQESTPPVIRSKTDDSYLYESHKLIDNIKGKKTRFTPQQILASVAIFWSSRKLVNRGVDTYTIRDKSIERKFLMHGQLPPALHDRNDPDGKYLPAMTIGKSAEIKGFETTFNGKTVGLLPRKAWNQLAEEIIETLLNIAMQGQCNNYSEVLNAATTVINSDKCDYFKNEFEKNSLRELLEEARKFCAENLNENSEELDEKILSILVCEVANVRREEDLPPNLKGHLNDLKNNVLEETWEKVIRDSKKPKLSYGDFLDAWIESLDSDQDGEIQKVQLTQKKDETHDKLFRNDSLQSQMEDVWKFYENNPQANPPNNQKGVNEKFLKILLHVAGVQYKKDFGKYSKAEKALLRKAKSNGKPNFEKLAKKWEKKTTKDKKKWGEKIPEDKELKLSHGDFLAAWIECLTISNGEDKDKEVRELMRKKAAKFVRYYSKNYVLLAHGQPKKNGDFCVSYTHPSLIETHKVSDELKPFKGIPVGRIPLQLDDAAIVKNYYLFIEGEEGTYVRDQGISCDFNNSTKPKQEDLFNHQNDSYCRLSSPEGGPRSRVYIRNCSPEVVREKKMHAWFEFSEVPPGSITKAFLTSLALFALTVIIGWTFIKNNDTTFTTVGSSESFTTTGSPGGTVETSMISLLLLFPGAIAAYVGVELPTGRMLSKTIAGTSTARLSLIVTTVVSIVAVALLVAYSVWHPTTWWPKWSWLPLPLDNYASLGTNNFWWYLLELIILANTAVMYRYYIIRKSNYKNSCSVEKNPGRLKIRKNKTKPSLDIDNPADGSSFIPMTEDETNEGLKALINFFKVFRLEHIANNEFKLVNNSGSDATEITLETMGWNGSHIPEGNIEIIQGESHELTLNYPTTGGQAPPEFFKVRFKKQDQPNIWAEVNLPFPPELISDSKVPQSTFPFSIENAW